MNWAYGERNGREIGYSVEAQCDEDGCSMVIDRGLSYRCGGHHFDDMETCDKYYCPSHLIQIEVIANDGSKILTQVCKRCAGLLKSLYDH